MCLSNNWSWIILKYDLKKHYWWSVKPISGQNPALPHHKVSMKPFLISMYTPHILNLYPFQSIKTKITSGIYAWSYFFQPNGEKKKVAVLFRDLHYYGFIILKYLLAFEVIVISGETIWLCLISLSKWTFFLLASLYKASGSLFFLYFLTSVWCVVFARPAAFLTAQQLSLFSAACIDSRDAIISEMFILIELLFLHSVCLFESIWM